MLSCSRALLSSGRDVTLGEEQGPSFGTKKKLALKDGLYGFKTHLLDLVKFQKDDNVF